ERIAIRARIDYNEVDRILGDVTANDDRARTLRTLAHAANTLRERRRRSGALLLQRREPKVQVRDAEIDVRILDTGSPSRILVGEFMILSNFAAARYAAENRIPIIYRVQPRAA